MSIVSQTSGSRIRVSTKKIEVEVEILEKRIKELVDYIEHLGSQHDVCTQHITKKICHGCRCSRKL